MSVSWSRRAAAAAVAGAVILSGPARIGATEAPSSTPVIAQAGQRTFATIIVNGEQRAEQIVLVKSDGAYASLAALRASGLVLPPRFDGGDVDRYVKVADLAPEIIAVFDLNGPILRLDAAAAGSLARGSTISFASGGDVTRNAVAPKSGYLNYSLQAGSAGLSGAEELTLSDASKTLFSAGTFDAHGFRRSLTNLTWTSAVARRRTTIGDVIADSGELGSALTITGVSIARASNIDPDGQAYASPTLRGTVLTPSTADVYVNGQLIRTVEVAPGTVDFSNLPGATGVTNATIVLRDAFGREQSLSTRYYGAASVLNKGTTDYSFSAGASRSALASGTPAGNLVALGRYRLGLTQSTTVGAHAEFASGFENLGATVSHTGSLGTWDVNVAESRDRGASGLAGSVGYYAGTRSLWLTAAIRAATPAYASFGERGFTDRTTSEGRVSLAMRPFRGSFTSAISYSASRSLLGGASRQISVQQAVSLPGGVSLLVTAGTSGTRAGTQHDLGVFLFRSAPRNSFVPTVNASLQSDGSALRRAVELERAAPPSGGMGYDVTSYASGPTVSSGRFTTLSPAGNVAVDFDVARGGRLTGNVAVGGAIAFAGPFVHLAQPISDSFAIVNVVGGARVRVLLDNQEVGMTDRSGMLVVANLPSYSTQRISIDRDDGPVNLDLSNTGRALNVASGHGALAQFSASVVTAIIGTVSVSGAGGRTIPAFGQLSLRSGEKIVSSELDRDGHFYLEDVAAGSHAAVIHYGGGECRFTMEIPRRAGIEQNVGEFTCARP
ncbi:MAG: fimD [Candidatus Eremiobacteraeota bacterium]|nr:fimD [Candidatus Eremiobacteraeota bacterium]